MRIEPGGNNYAGSVGADATLQMGENPSEMGFARNTPDCRRECGTP